MVETHIVIAGHRRALSCNPADAARQQWFPAASEEDANRIAQQLRSGRRKMRCPWCERLVKASTVEVRPFHTGTGTL